MRHAATTFSLLVAVALCALLLSALRRDDGASASSRRSGRLLNLPFDAVNGLRVERGSWSCDFGKTSSGWASRDRGEPADDTAIQRLLDQIESAPCYEVITAREQDRRRLDFSLFGLSSPRATLHVRAGARDIELFFGTNSPVAGELFVGIGGTRDVFVSSTNLFAALPDSRSTLLDHALLRDDPSRIEAIALWRPGQAFVRLQRSGASWKLASPVPMPADASVVQRLLAAFAAAKLAGFLPDSPADFPEDDSCRIEFRTSSGAVLSRSFGPPSPDAPGLVPVRFSNGQSGRVTNAIPALLSIPLEDLFDPSPFSAPPGAVSSLSVRRDRQSLVLRRLPDASWEMTLPSHGPADSDSVTRLLDGILRLRAERVEPILPSSSPAGLALAIPSAPPSSVPAPAGPALAGPPSSSHPASAAPSPAGDAPEVPALATNRLCDVEIVFTNGVSRLVRVESITSVPFRPGFPSAPDAVAPFAGNPHPQPVSVAVLSSTNVPVRYILSITNLPGVLRSTVDLAALRSRTVFSLNPASIRKVAIRQGGEDGSRATLVRTASGWASDRRTSLDESAIHGYLHALATLTADRVLAIGLPPEELDDGAPPWMEITLDLESADSVRKTLVIGSRTADGGRSAYLRGHDTAVELSPSTLDLLLRLFSSISPPPAP